MKKKRNKQNWMISLIMMLFILTIGYKIKAQTTQTFTTSGTYTVPAGVTSITVSAWGGGGAGGGVDGNGSGRAGGGGEGGSFVRGTLTVVPGATYTVVVGSGGAGVVSANGGSGQASSFSVPAGATLFNAIGGAFGAVGNNLGAGGNAANTGNIVSGTTTSNFYGGNGGTATNASTSSSGGGGGSAGAGGAGGNGGSPLTGGTAGAGSGSPSDPGVVGATGRGSQNDGDGIDGGAPGAGGSGARNANNNTNYQGGDGGAGQIKVTWTCPSYALTGTSGVTPICTSAGTSTITLTGLAASLPAGTYTVTYDRSLPSATGLTAAMTVSVAGSGSFTATGLTTAGSSTITVTNLSSGTTGGTCSSNISSNRTAVITVNGTPTISSQPSSQTICNGNPVTFTVTASGTPSPTYQWRKGGSNISGATLTSYNIAAVAGTDAATYDVVVTNSCSAVPSSGAVLTVNTAPSISVHPVAQTKCTGQSVTFSVTAAGTSPTYQWRKGGVNISGATNSSYTISSIVSGDAASYDVVVAVANCTSVTSTGAALTVNTAPAISSQPSSQAICNGNPVTFSVTGSGTPAPTYQWKKGGVDISGATLTSYNIPAVSGGDAATYTVALANSCNTVTSSNAVLTVNTPPSISVHPVSQAKCTGNSVTFTVTAAGTSPTYQWRKGGVNISGATLSSYSISSVAAGDAASYDVNVSVANCTSLASSAAVLTVNPLPTVYAVNGGGVYCQNGSGSVVGLSNSQSGVNYQLKIGGVATGSPVAGTNAAISFGGQTAAGTYTVDATNATTTCAQAMTGSAAVSINPAPTAVSATPSSSLVCASATSVALAGAATTTSISTVNTDNFDATPTYTGSGSISGNRSQIFTKVNSGTNVNSVATFTSTNGGGIMLTLAAASAVVGTSTSSATSLLTSATINTNNFTTLALSYRHTYKQGNSGSPSGKVEVSTNGSTWTTLKTFTTDQGGTTSFVADNITLSNTYLNQSNLQLRFNFVSSNSSFLSANASWWAIDDVLLNGNPVPLFSWTANTGAGINGLPGGAGTGSAANKNITVVPTATTIYTMTAADAVTGCTSTTTSTVTVNPIATVSAGSNQTICSNATATMNGSFGGGASSATWSSSGSGSFDNNNVDAIYTPSAADKTAGSVVLTYTTNDPAGPCGSANASMTLTINAIPSITSDPSNATACENGNASFSVAATGTGISYQWRKGTNNLSNGGNISGANSATLTITGVLLSDAASDYNCVVSGVCEPGATSANVSLTVNTAPSISPIGNLSLNTSGNCNGSVSNAQLLDQVSSSGSPAPSVTFNPSAGNFNVGTTLVTATAQNTCGSVQTTFNVIITDNENPSLSACPANITVNNESGLCGAHVNWTAPTASDNCSAIVSSNHNSGDLFTVGTTTVNYNAVDPSNNSASCSFTVTVVDNEAPVAACKNLSITLDNAGNAGIIASQLNNSSSDNCTIDHFTLSLNSFDCSNVGANSVTLTAYDAVGNFSACPATVTVVPFATAVVSGISSICISDNATVHVEFNGTAPFNYTISDGSQSVSGTTSNNVEDILINTPAEGVHSFTVTSFSDAICSGVASGAASVTVNPVPNVLMITSIAAPSEACNGTVVLLTANISNAFSFNYNWSTGINLSVVKFSNSVDGPFVSGPFETSSNTVYAQFGSLVGSSGYNVGVEISNACGTSAYFYKWVRGIMGMPGSIAGSSIACSNQTGINYSVVQTVASAVYNWTFSVAGATINGQGTNNVTVNFPTFTSGQLCVTAALSCGGSSTSAARCLTISNTTGLPSPISGASKVCPGSSNVAYSVTPLAGAVSYNWTVPSGATIVESAPYSNSIHVNFPANYNTTAPIYVYGVSQCGVQSAGRNKSVGTYIPNTPGNISGPSGNICNSTVQYSINNVSGATGYTWTIPAGATNFIGQGSTSIQFTAPVGFTNGYVSVTANTNACTPGSSSARSLAVTGAPSTPGNITLNPSAWCVGQTINASVATTSPLPVYNWIINNGTIDAGQGSNNVDVITNNSHVIIQVRASNACGISGNRTLHTYSAGCREEEVIQSLNNVTAAPNPAHNMITVSIGAKQSSDITLSMIDISGRTVLKEKLSATAGMNKYEVNLDHFKKGIYVMQADFSGEIQKIKVVIE